MESLEKQYNQVLIRLFGTQVEKDLKVLKAKFNVVVAAHLFSGNQGSSAFCQLNRLLEKEVKLEVKK